ncbi:MAG: Fic family protein [Gemmatimonadota bacterium]
MQDRLDARLKELPAAAVHGIIARIAEIDEFKGWWGGRDLPAPAILARLKKRAIAASADLASHVGRGVPPDPSRAAGYAEVLRAVFDGHADMALGEELVLRLHGRLLRYSARDQGTRGTYKTVPNRATAIPHRGIEAVALRPTDPLLTPQEMRAATGWAVSRLASRAFHPLLVNAGFILEFLAIRPFADGNGRLSRILTTLLLLKSGYAFVPYASLEKAIADRRTEYYLALRRSQANRNLPRPDISPWLAAFLDAVRAQARGLKEAVSGRPAESLLSENQLAVLDLLQRNREVTNRLVCRELGIPRDTAKQVLARLTGLNLIQRAGAGRAARYRKAPLQGTGAAAR